MEFKPFDPAAETRKYRNHLPHWRQPGVTYFVTARLADSIPQTTLQIWMNERDVWLRVNGCTSTSDVETLPEWKRKEFHKINQRLGRTGALWQAESFNHIVRSEEQLTKFRTYIGENPVRARLGLGEYLLWSPE
jgi:hypothetical protein